MVYLYFSATHLQVCFGTSILCFFCRAGETRAAQVFGVLAARVSPVLQIYALNLMDVSASLFVSILAISHANWSLAGTDVRRSITWLQQNNYQ